MKVVRPYFGKGAGCKILPDHFVDFSQPILRYMGEHLPHWEQEGKLQYITLRLADSIPKSKIEKLQEKRSQLQNADTFQDRDDYLKEIEQLLAIGTGTCILKYDEIQNVVKDTLMHYDGLNYDLYEFVIMSNHLHFIMLPYKSPKIILADFKRYTSRQIKRILGTCDSVWQKEFFDRLVRDDKDYREIAEYIRLNPEGINKI